EAELVRRCRAGERAAQEELYRRHRRQVGANLYRVLGRRDDLDALVQEVFAFAFRGLAPFRCEARLSPRPYPHPGNLASRPRRAGRSRRPGAGGVRHRLPRARSLPRRGAAVDLAVPHLRQRRARAHPGARAAAGAGAAHRRRARGQRGRRGARRRSRAGALGQAGPRAGLPRARGDAAQEAPGALPARDRGARPQGDRLPRRRAPGHRAHAPVLRAPRVLPPHRGGGRVSRRGHVPAHRLAAAAAGRLGERDRRRISRHLERCRRCAAAGERIARARAAMDRIATAEPPDIGWEQIGVRLYWETSSARYAALRRERRPWWRRRAPLVAGGAGVLAAAAAAAVIALGARGGDGGGAAPVAAPAPATSPGAAADAPTERPPAPDERPAALAGVVTFARGDVLVDGAPPPRGAVFARSIAAGAELSTGGDGRLVVQFGHRSGLALEPDSRARLRRFDRGGIELEVDGVV